MVRNVKALIEKMHKPLPCCARCKSWGRKCKNTRPSYLCNEFVNDGTAEDLKL